MCGSTGTEPEDINDWRVYVMSFGLPHINILFTPIHGPFQNPTQHWKKKRAMQCPTL